MTHKTVPDGRVLGVDISGPMLKSASKRASQLPSNLKDAIALEQADASLQLAQRILLGPAVDLDQDRCDQ